MSTKGKRRRRREFRHLGQTTGPTGAVQTSAEAHATKIRAFCFDGHSIKEKEEVVATALSEVVAVGRNSWVDISGLADGEALRVLAERFRLHPLALEDVVHVHQRAKVEEFDQHLFIVLRMPEWIDGRLESDQMSLFLGKDYLVSFQDRPGDCLDPVRERLRRNRGRLRASGADYLAYSLIDVIIDSYFPIVEQLGDKLEQVEQAIADGNEGVDLMHRLHEVRSDLLHLRRMIWPHREMVGQLIRSDHGMIQSETRVYLRDCYDHTVQLLDVVETYRELCADLRDLHYTQLGQRNNDVMKLLTIISTIFIPITFVAGVYGMNFEGAASWWNMPELRSRWGYPIAVGVMMLMALTMVAYFYRRGWIFQGRRRNS
jgi:magnesium transporter